MDYSYIILKNLDFLAADFVIVMDVLTDPEYFTLSAGIISTVCFPALKLFVEKPNAPL